MTEREREILAASLRRWADVERTDGNTIAAGLLDGLRADVERIPGADDSAGNRARPRVKVVVNGVVRYRRECAA